MMDVYPVTCQVCEDPFSGPSCWNLAFPISPSTVLTHQDMTRSKTSMRQYQSSKEDTNTRNPTTATYITPSHALD